MKIYVEGGGKGIPNRRCREGFKELLTRAGIPASQFQVIACGPRHKAYERFCSSLDSAVGARSFLWVDSEETVADINKTWEHVLKREGDGWQRPTAANDEHLLFMTTCMETLFIADRPTLQTHYGRKLRISALPRHSHLEKVDRKDALKSLEDATRDTSKPYAKNAHSFELLGKLNVDRLKDTLPSFNRTIEILDKKL